MKQKENEKCAQLELSNLCLYTQEVLREVYQDLHFVEDFCPYILPKDSGLAGSSRVLFEEESESSDLFLGIHFCASLRTSIEENGHSLQTLSVVAEETSHFLALADTASRGGQTSLLNLEVLGEIDRFLVFCHRFSFGGRTPLKLQAVLDLLFEQHPLREGLSPEETLRYQEAEHLAFHYLKSAFGNTWSQSHVDWGTLLRVAPAPLEELRRQMLGLGPRRWAA